MAWSHGWGTARPTAPMGSANPRGQGGREKGTSSWSRSRGEGGMLCGAQVRAYLPATYISVQCCGWRRHGGRAMQRRGKGSVCKSRERLLFAWWCTQHRTPPTGGQWQGLSCCAALHCAALRVLPCAALLCGVVFCLAMQGRVWSSAGLCHCAAVQQDSPLAWHGMARREGMRGS